MQQKRRMLIVLFSSLCLLVLILDSQTALHSAISGMEQCFYTVIPALFPFFIFSALLTGVLSGANIPILRSVIGHTGIPAGAETLFLVGILGGYPVGAHCIAQAYERGGLSKKDALRMLGFCVNAGPSFIFGICSAMFTNPMIPWLLWLIHIFSAYLVGIALPGKQKGQTAKVCRNTVTFTGALRGSIINMAQVCGWIVLFRVLIGFLDRWILWIIPNDMRCLFLGSLELTNGCIALRNVQSEQLKFIICSAILALGGLSVTMQVHTVAGRLGVGMYIPGKLLHCLISTVMAMLAQHFLFTTGISIHDAAAPGILLAFLITALIPFSTLYKKRGSISERNHV